MPAKRRTTKKKAAAAAAPAVEPKEETPVVAEVKPEPTPEPVTQEPVTENVEDTNDDEVDDVENNDAVDETKAKKEPLTLEEKIALLDKLSKAHPFGLLMNLAKLSNHAKPHFKVEKNKKPEDFPADQTFEKSMSLIVKYGENKITVPSIPGENYRFAKKVGADLLLKKLYGDDHEVEPETASIMENADANIEYGEDKEWAKEAQEKFDTWSNNRVDKIIAKINANDRYDDASKKVKIERYEKWRGAFDGLMAYDDIYKQFDHPYYKVLNNALYSNRSLKYETKLFKFEGDNEVEIAVKSTAGKKRKSDDESSQEEKPSESDVAKAEENGENLTKFKVGIRVLKNNECILELEHIDDCTKLREAKSEAAYKVLEKLLTDGVINQVDRRHLKDLRVNNSRFGNNRFGNNRFNNRFNNRNNNRFQNNRNNNRNNNQKGKKPNPNQNKNNNQQNQQNQQNQMMAQQMMMGGGMPMMGNMGGQQMMMMPVMMGPNGQMMIASNAQPMMMMPQGMTTAPAKPNNNKKKNNNKKGGKKPKKE